MMQSEKLILGRQDSGQSKVIGFSQQVKSKRIKNTPELIYHDMNAHLCTISRTGGGKGVSSVIPNLLHYPGSMTVLDVKGELSAVTARHRSQFGKVIHLSPFDSNGSDAFNPLSLINLESDVEVISQLIASLIGPQDSFSREPYWDEQARSILAGVLAAVMTDSDPIKRNMTEVCKLLFADDTIYTLATLLDIRKDLPKMAYQNISSLLQTVEVTRSGILSTTQSYLKSFNVSRILKTLDTSSFSLEDFQHGISTSIYINIPPAYLKSHAAYVKLIVGTLMHAITTRKTMPVLPTVFVLDEASSLGCFDQLSSMISLGRGFGCLTHTLWQDLSQIKKCYPDWESVINNSTLQIFGVGSHLAARTLSEVIGIHPEKILNLPKDQQILVLEGNVQLCEKLNYLNDSNFKGKYDRNPLINQPFQKIFTSPQKM